MNCPLHKDEWLFPNDYKSHGWCSECKRWYLLEIEEDSDEE